MPPPVRRKTLVLILALGAALAFAAVAYAGNGGFAPVTPRSPNAARINSTYKWIALYTPLPWPQGILTRPEIDQEAGGSCPVDFGTDLAEVELLLKRIAAAHARHNWPVHPIFGRMSGSDWLRWAYLHTDHHLRQFGA